MADIVQVSFKNMKHSAAIEEYSRQQCEKLDKYFSGIQSCRVTIEIPHKRHEKGNLFQVRIDMTVPGAELVVETKLAKYLGYENLQAVLNDSFDMAKRRLEDYARKKRGLVKMHAERPDPDEEAEIREIERAQMQEFLR